jgi:5,5'-dehydrodivanillate O-demethylase oxygenase subunit
MISASEHTAQRHSKDDSADYVHVGPGTLGGRYLRRFWHPVYLADDLPAGHAKPIRILGEDYTLYRGADGAPHVVAPRCAHRGTQLSTGWVEGECIRCFYHGWKYDAAGQCVEMPAEDASFLPKVRIAAYPTEEYLGLIFAYLSEGAAPPLPRYPELEGDGLLDVSTYVRHCSYFNSLENGIDEVHVNFAHRASGFTEFGLNWDVPQVSAEETEYGLVQYGVRANGVRRVTPFLMPNILYIKGSPDDTESGWRDAVAWRVPLDDVRHQSFNARRIHVSGEAAARYLARQERYREQLAGLPSAREVADAILAGRLRMADVEGRPDIVNIQDHVAQEGQGAIADATAERLGRSDVAIILLRSLYTRELKALAAGRPLKQWARAERLVATSGV